MEKRILFVDDEGDWRFMASTYLKEAGYEILTAKDGTDALMLSHGVKLSLIILDVNLAGENGVVLMGLFKRNHPGVPIILYTGMDHDAAAIDGMIKQGAHQYLRKGTMEELLKAVQSAVK
ncbi:MAG: two component, sigma54 specific, transcriptional regulator, Fis family [Pedosphaera sp.]|nr:two component, sigma54 specific, transcriptional regulator, Fis family [Pedosphaera sp.]